MKKEKVSIFWFRRDLRINDNRGLAHALNSGKKIVPVFIFDKTILNKLDNQYDRRVDFIHQALCRLQEDLIKQQSSLKMFHDTALNAFKQLCEEFEIETVYTNNDYEPEAIQRDQTIQDFLAVKKSTWVSVKDQVIFEKNEILKSDGSPYTIFTPYSKIWKKLYIEQLSSQAPVKMKLENLLKTEPIQIASLISLGFKKTDLVFNAPQLNKNIVKNYDKARNIPSVNGTTQLSIHFRFGTISMREATLFAYKNNDQWLNELIWREFFMQILFHFPHVVHQSFKKKYDAIPWRNDENEFYLWCEGKTGYPIVDAGMRELNTTGFMHNRVRMIVASFLTKHLLIDWRWGESYFAQKLNDFELSANNGNWQWAAGSGCDAAPYFRIFNPYEQTLRFDPQALYIRKWLPEFEELDYPKPIVEHKFARERALKTYKKALINE